MRWLNIDKMYDNVSYSSVLCVLLILTSSAVGSESDTDSKHSLNYRIVNGTEAFLGQFAHQVSLRRSWSGLHFCGGSAIGEQWILTAAHCMYLNNALIQPWSVQVVGGEIWLNSTSATGQRSGVSDIIIHRSFDRLTLHNDVALLKLETPFVYNSTALMSKELQTESVPSDTECQVAGWGHPNYDIHVVTNELQYVNLPILNQTLCRQLMVNYSDVPEGMFCAGYVDGSKDACQGDSGGGLICNGAITGIVSGGIGCAWPNYPGLYTDVQYYRSWIVEYTGLTDASTESGSSGFVPSIQTHALLLCALIISAKYT